MGSLEQPAPGLQYHHSFLSHAAGVDLGSLGLLQRLLLVSDGTLTDIVEAAFLEPIQLVKLSVETFPSRLAVEGLDLDAGEIVMRRRILLRGASSGNNYVYAESLIAVDRLNPDLRTDLMNSNNALGRVWVRHRLETRKEILRVWRENGGEPASYFGAAGGSLLARTYRVVSGARPIMLITEYFPA